MCADYIKKAEETCRDQDILLDKRSLPTERTIEDVLRCDIDDEMTGTIK